MVKYTLLFFFKLKNTYENPVLFFRMYPPGTQSRDFVILYPLCKGKSCLFN